jgi:hypothetical protein
MTCYRAGYLPDGRWQVEQSPDGIHAEVIATFAKASEARAFIDSVTGVLRPAREEADGSPPTSASSRAGRGSGTAASLGLGGSLAER